MPGSSCTLPCAVAVLGVAGRGMHHTGALLVLGTGSTGVVAEVSPVHHGEHSGRGLIVKAV